MATARVIIYRGDTPLFKFTLRHNDGTVVDLTDADVYLSAKSLSPDSVIFSVQCTVTNPTGGEAEKRLTITETEKAGEFMGEVEIRYSTPGHIFTAQHFELRICDDVKK